jgi:uncharacterized repeat protein (TIGR03803 family)
MKQIYEIASKRNACTLVAVLGKKRRFQLMQEKRSLLIHNCIWTIALLLTSTITLPVSAQTFSIIHRFRGGTGTGNPNFQLVQDAAGNLYGTTNWGCQDQGCGAVYRLSPNGNQWTYTVLYRFSIGSEPSNLTLDAVGNLYGALSQGGRYGAGLVFELSPTATPPWTFTTLYAFTGGSDGSLPTGGLVFDAEGNLYGTTRYGGAPSSSGTVFELSPQSGGGWTEEVVWAFSLGSSVGYNPNAGVIFDTQGNLYGTTDGQGIHDGTVYKLTNGTSGWTATSLYQFTGGTDGGFPEAPVAMDAAGNLYGTTIIGGYVKGGTVYELSPDGNGGYSFQVLHSFGKTGTSYYPVVIDSGNLIGVADGGAANFPGFVFKLTHIDSSWSYEVLHRFHDNDGFQPNTVMIDPTGNLYGVTNDGGLAGCVNDSGCGVVFKLKQP